MTELDIVIPVYNEGENIVPALESFQKHIKTPYRVLICYDRDDDTTLPALETFKKNGMEIVLIKNRKQGVLDAVKTGLEHSTAPAILTFPADDDFNAPLIDTMVAKLREGNDIVVGSRFMPGGCMKGCPFLKAFIVRTSAFVLHFIARLPTHDPSTGLRLFSRRVIEQIPIESKVGWAYSIELLVKAHRRGWPVSEVPVAWHERKKGQSRFKVLKWLPQYFKWFRYAFATTLLHRGGNRGMPAR